MKANPHGRVSKDMWFCFRCRRYRRDKPALKIHGRLLCIDCKEEGM